MTRPKPAWWRFIQLYCGSVVWGTLFVGIPLLVVTAIVSSTRWRDASGVFAWSSVMGTLLFALLPASLLLKESETQESLGGFVSDRIEPALFRVAAEAGSFVVVLLLVILWFVAVVFVVGGVAGLLWFGVRQLL